MVEFEKLMQQYLDDELSPSEVEIFLTYLNTDSSYRKIYEELVQTYAIFSTPIFEKRRKDNFEQLCRQLNMNVVKRQPLYRNVWVWRAAAILLLFFGFATVINQPQKEASDSTIPPSFCNIETTKDSSTKLLLPDSTVVYLNESSTLKYDVSFNQKEIREVFLTGEGYFEVRENISKPFIVHTEDLHIKVLGTTFNVSSYLDEPTIKVSLVEGMVNVFTSLEMQDNVILLPSEQAIYNKELKQLRMQQTDISQQTSWLRGRLVFSNQSLREILKIIGAKYSVDISVQSHLVDNEFFTGSIDVSLSLDEVFSHLDVDNKYRWKQKGQKVILTDK